MTAKHPLESAEDRLIARYFKPLATHPGAFGLNDDAAIYTPPPGHDVVLKTDGVIAGVHVFPDDPAGDIARKALRVNLSDLAAKGAKPVGFLLAIALRSDTDPAWLTDFAHGLAADAEAYSCPLFGGDTDRTPGPISISISAFGIVPSGTMVKRSGAKPGDRVFVTGTIGDAALGLKLRQDVDAAARWRLDAAMRAHLLDRYRLPQPRMGIADTLRAHASAAMDVSDGLVGDLAKLCRASGVAAKIDVGRVPLSPAAQAARRAEPGVIEPILTGGDDYEVLGTVPADRLAALIAGARAVGIDVTDVGHVEAGDVTEFRAEDGTNLVFEHASFSHF